MVEYFVAPIIGGIIGYITNDIAIRMLFRPHTAKYILGIHIPFTPGIIPKEKSRIADAIGDVISENLMSKDVLGKYLLSDEMVNKVRTSVDSFIEIQKENEETTRALLGHYLSSKEIQTVSASVNQYITEQVGEKLSDPSVGVQVAHLAMEYVSQKLEGNESNELLSFVGGAMRATADLIIGPFLSMLREPTEKFLAKTINGMLQSNGNSIISNMIDGEFDTFLDKKVCVLLKGHDEQLKQAVDKVESIYRTVIIEHLPQILDSVDIRKIVRERINEMNVNETEELIFKVMRKELKAIVWLGALLGFIMGSINCFIL